MRRKHTKYRNRSSKKVVGEREHPTHRRRVAVGFDDDVFEYLAEEAFNKDMSFGSFVNNICKEKLNGI